MEHNHTSRTHPKNLFKYFLIEILDAEGTDCSSLRRQALDNLSMNICNKIENKHAHMIYDNNDCVTITHQPLTVTDKREVRTLVSTTNLILMLTGEFHDGLDHVMCVGARKGNYVPTFLL